MTSDHLYTSFVLKSVVASCVFMDEVRIHVFYVFVSSKKERPHRQSQKCSSPDQHKTCLSLAINAFVCSVISHSEVSSGGNLVASNKHVCMQCDVILGGE